MEFRGSTVGDVYRKVMGDAPLAYAETVGNVRVSEDDLVTVGKNDVSDFIFPKFCSLIDDSRSYRSRSAVAEDRRIRLARAKYTS